MYTAFLIILSGIGINLWNTCYGNEYIFFCSLELNLQIYSETARWILLNHVLVNHVLINRILVNRDLTIISAFTGKQPWTEEAYAGRFSKLSQSGISLEERSFERAIALLLPLFYLYRHDSLIHLDYEINLHLLMEYHIWSYLEPENTACRSYLEPNQQLNKHIQNQMYRICTEAHFSSSMLCQEKPDLYQSGIIHARPEDRSSIRAMESPSE